MAPKRKDSPSFLVEDTTSTKRHKASTKNHDPTPYIDATYGQRGFFPEPLADASNVDEDSAAALAYLTSVRHEASSIPHLLIAPTPANDAKPHSTSDEDLYNDDSYEEEGGFYQDGAYVAAPSLGPHLPQSLAEPGQLLETTAKEACHARMLFRYDKLSAQLDHTAQHNLAHSNDAHDWDRPPRLTSLTRLADGMPLRMLLKAKDRLCRSRLLNEKTRAQAFGAWCWALLAKTPDLGTLDSEEVGSVRELGKKAAMLANTLAIEMAELGGFLATGALGEDEDEDQFEDDEDEHAEDDGEEYKANTTPATSNRHRPQVTSNGRRRNSSSSIESHDGADATPLAPTTAPLLTKAEAYAQRDATLTKGSATADSDSDDGEIDETDDIGSVSARDVAVATLDMIITIVGERYGQRDLLPARDMLWEADELRSWR